MEKISLLSIQKTLSRNEMRNIMAGSGSGATPECNQCCTTDSFCSKTVSCPCCIRGRCLPDKI